MSFAPPPPPFGAPAPVRNRAGGASSEIEGGEWGASMRLDDAPPPADREARKHGSASAATSACQLLLGLALGACCYHALLFGALQGLFLALCQVAVGVSGLLASAPSSVTRLAKSVTRRQLLIGHLVGGILVLLLGSSFVAQLGRDVAYECSLAELYLEVGELRHIAGPSNDELFSLVSSRIDELDSQIQESASHLTKVVSDKHKAEKLKHTDSSYIRSKIEILRKHAHAILDDPSLADPEGAGINRLPEAARRELENRLDSAEAVLDRVAMHDEGMGETITPEEYQDLLQALTNAWVSPASPKAARGPPPDAGELIQAAREIPAIRAAMHRQSSDKYEPASGPDDPQRILEHMAKVREAKQRRWAEAFAKARSGRAGRADDLGSLPEHCLQEEAARDAIILIGIGGLVAQALELYFASTYLARVAMKGE